MTIQFKDALRVASVICGVAILTGTTGCASLRMDIEEVRSIAESAQSDANAAQSAANEARQLASGAQSTANQALSAAQDAQACCDATNQRIDRMFEEMQQK